MKKKKKQTKKEEEEELYEENIRYSKYLKKIDDEDD